MKIKIASILIYHLHMPCWKAPTLNVREAHSQLWGTSLYGPLILRLNMIRDLAHLQLSDLPGEIRPICRTSDLQGKRMLLYEFSLHVFDS